MKHSLQLKLGQHLALTPQLQQSIRLLQLSTLELNQELEQMLQDNPLLEREEEDDAAFDAEARFGVPYAAVPDHKAYECAAILRGERPGFFYMRASNPTTRQLELTRASMQDRDDCLATASGVKTSSCSLRYSGARKIALLSS